MINHMHILDVKNDSLSELIKAIKKPIIIDFWAPWCEPCRQINPLLFNIAEELVGKIKVLKVNIEENQDTAKKQEITSIPTLIILDNKGKKIGDPIVGFSSNLREVIFNRLNPFINQE